MLKPTILFAFLLVASIHAENCDQHGHLIYEDLGCQPVNPSGASCPTKYTCDGIYDACNFRGRTYKDFEVVDNAIASHSCDQSCFCHRKLLDCGILKCPEWTWHHSDTDCYFKYSLDFCCTVGQTCKRKDALAKCKVDGSTYLEGEKFYPKDTCLKCVCLANFKGRLEAPFCERMKCGAQLKRDRQVQIRQGCAPLYETIKYETKKNESVLCCPSSWVCPDGMEVIEGTTTSEDTCKFGDLSLKVGQFFNRTSQESPYGAKVAKMECKCAIPPLLTCIA